MGNAADDTDRQMKESREHAGETIDSPEDRAGTGAMRYARIAIIALGVAAVAGAGFLVYRRVRRRSRTEQLQTKLVDLLKNLPESVRDVPHGVTSRLKNPFPSFKVVVNGSDETREEGTLRSVVRKVAPAVVGTASTAALDRLTRTPGDVRPRATSADQT
jgi:hypothetical protein